MLINTETQAGVSVSKQSPGTSRFLHAGQGGGFAGRPHLAMVSLTATGA
ncbi:MAG: hypothetical protein ACT4SY_13070 [Hyphomicrobiales bacterium]